MTRSDLVEELANRFAQLTHRESLRDVESALGSRARKNAGTPMVLMVYNTYRTVRDAKPAEYEAAAKFAEVAH